MWIISDCDDCGCQGLSVDIDKPCENCSGWGFLPVKAHPILALAPEIVFYPSKGDAQAVIETIE